MTYPANYHNRFDASKNYDAHLFLEGGTLQAAELNEIQSNFSNRLQNVANVLFKDGDIIRDADIIVNSTAGTCACQSGAVYVRGTVRGVQPATLQISVTTTVIVGIYLTDTIVTAVDDPFLTDPAIGAFNNQEPGASRLKTTALWGTATAVQSGDFYPVYTVEKGIVLSKLPPPQIEAVSNAIARYDSQSTGGYYVSSGLSVTRLANANGKEYFSVAEGIARVNGKEVSLQHSVRVEHNAIPFTKAVANEPYTAVGGTERINLNFFPVTAISQVSITKVETVTLTHGAFTGVQDLLPNTPVVQIMSVVQGGTTYVAGTSYNLTANKVDWSPAGAEPAPGSTYTVTYRYISVVTPTAIDAYGCSVTGAVAGTLIQVSYSWALSRIDRICLDHDGSIKVIVGVSAVQSPMRPDTPSFMLSLALVTQTWGINDVLVNDATRLVPMQDLIKSKAQIEDLYALVSANMLALNIAMNNVTTKKGVFVDPF